MLSLTPAPPPRKALQAALVQLASEGDAATKNVISSGGGLTSGEGSSLPTVKPSHWPKYIRVNTLKATLSEAVSSAKEKFGEANVAVHQVVDNVLVLPSTVNDLYEWDMIVRGEVIIQDLSSCLTAVALGGGNGTRWWDVGPAKKKGKKGKDKNGVVMLDACAAPGNKTTHLAAIVNDGCEVQNQVIALDRASEVRKSL
jgi:putative methyltransferase